MQHSLRFKAVVMKGKLGKLFDATWQVLASPAVWQLEADMVHEWKVHLEAFGPEVAPVSDLQLCIFFKRAI